MGKREIGRELQFRQGLVASPNPRDRGGVIDAQNVMLTPDGSALMPLPGYRRVYPYPIVQTGSIGTPPGFQIVTVPAQAFGATTGIGLAVGDEATGRVVAVGWHPGGIVQDPTVTPAPVLQDRIFARHTNEFPNMIVARDKTLIVPEGDAVRVWDGAVLQTAGILDPRFAPTFTTDNTTPPGTLGQYVIDVKYIGGDFYAHPGVAYDWTRNAILLYSDATAIPPTIADTLALAGRTWGQSVTLIQAVVHSGTCPWAALLGLLVTDTDSTDTLATSGAMLSVTDAAAVAVTDSTGAQIGLKVLDPTVAFRVEYVGGGTDGQIDIGVAVANHCRLWYDWTNTVGDYYDIDYTSMTYAELVSAIDSQSDWTARLESASGSDTVLSGSVAINSITAGSPTAGSPAAVAVQDFGGVPVTIFTGGPGTAAKTEVVDTATPPSIVLPQPGIFPFIVRFTSKSSGSVASRDVDFGDDSVHGTDTGSPWYHTYDGSVVHESQKAGNIYTFQPTIIEVSSGDPGVADSSSDPALAVTGKFLSTTLEATAPCQYTWPASITSLQNKGDFNVVLSPPALDTNGQGAGSGAVWAEPFIYPLQPSLPATNPTYTNFHILVNSKVVAPIVAFQFALAKTFTLDPTAATRYQATVPFSFAFCVRKGWGGAIRRFLSYGGSPTDPTNWSWTYFGTNTHEDVHEVRTAGSDAQMVISLLRADGVEVARIKAGTTAIDDFGYMNPGINNLVFNAACTTLQTITDFNIRFVAAPPRWPNHTDNNLTRPKQLDINIGSIVISETATATT